MFNILIVDDEPLITKGVHSKIKRLDHPLIANIHEENYPLRALEYIKNSRPDIVISDMKMPKLNGIELAKEARKIHSDIKFIMLSGYDDYKYVRESFQQGAIDYLLKPVSAEDLKDKLSDAINMIEIEHETSF